MTKAEDAFSPILALVNLTKHIIHFFNITISTILAII